MKVWKFWPKDEESPFRWKTYEGKVDKAGFRAASDNVARKCAEVIKTYSNLNNVVFHVAALEKMKQDFATDVTVGDKITGETLDTLFVACLRDKIDLKLRDDSFRFVSFGLDFQMYLCFGHEDEELDVTGTGLLCADVSQMLIDSSSLDD